MVWELGDKIPAKDLVKYLDSLDTESRYANNGLVALRLDMDVYGWRIDHVAYKPKLRGYYRGEPGFVFVLEDPDNPEDNEVIEIPDGKEVRKFILEHVPYVYFIRNIGFWERKGYLIEYLLEEDPK